MYEFKKKKLENYWRVNLLGPGPRLVKKEFTGPRSHKRWETLVYTSHSGECHHMQFKTVTRFQAFITGVDQMVIFCGFESQTK